MIVMIGTIQASCGNITAGENCTFKIEDKYDKLTYTAVGNSSNMNGLEAHYNKSGYEITIETVKNFKPDNFTLVFFNDSTKVKEVHHHHGGGGGGTDIIYKNRTIDEGSNETKIEYFENDTKTNNLEERVGELENESQKKQNIIEDLIDKYKQSKESKNFWRNILIGLVILLGIGVLGYVFYKFLKEKNN